MARGRDGEMTMALLPSMRHAATMMGSDDGATMVGTVA
jgi:hypothetical protein